MREDKVLKLRVGDVTWWIDKERLDLFSEFINREGSSTVTVRDSAQRSVTSLSIDGGETVLFVKRQQYKTNLRLLKYLFVPSKGVAEWRMVRALAARGIPTSLPVAIGKKRRLGVLKETILVTVGLMEVCDLFQYTQEVLSSPAGPVRRVAKRELGLALAKFLGWAHKAGVFHRDLHGGNILVRKEEGGGLSLFLIDLHRVKLGRPSFSKVAANLSQLAAYFQEFSTRADRLRFLRAYLDTGERDKIYSLARAVEKRSRRLGLNFYLRREGSCLSENRDFASFIAGPLKAWVRRSYFCPDFKAFLCELWGPATVIKSSPGNCSGLISYSGLGPVRELYVKMQQIRGLRALRYLFSPSRPKRSWLATNGLLLRGVATPLPLAYLRRREGIFSQRHLFVSESPADTARIEDYIKQVSWSRAARKRFIADLASILKRLHQRGVYHGDLKANNILVRKDQGRGPELLLVDLDGAKFRKKISFRQRVKDLARINAALHHLFTVRERLFFFRLYERGDKELKGRRKKLLKSIARLSQKKIISKEKASAENEPAFG